MLAQPDSLYWLIVVCEAIFWFVLVLALVCRYFFQLGRLSFGLLVLLPAVDLTLLTLTAVDLRNGTTATIAHGLATAYIGFTVAFGPLVVRWADARFSHRFGSGPAPVGFATDGWLAVRDDLGLWLRCVVAWVITLLLLGVLSAYVRNAEVTQPLSIWYRVALGSVFLWFIFGPCWSVVRSAVPRRGT